LVGLWKKPVATILVEPADLSIAEEEDASEDEFAHALGVAFGIGNRERRAPRATHELPALDPEVVTQALHIVEEMLCGVLVQARVRRRSSAAALIEENDAVARRIVIAAHGRIAAAARSAMHDENRPALPVAALLEVDLVPAPDLKTAGPVRLDRCVEAELLA